MKLETSMPDQSGTAEVYECGSSGVGQYLKAVPGSSQGKQSQIGILDVPDVQSDTDPILLKRMGSGKGLTRQEAVELHGHLESYQESLRSAGWNVPTLFDSHVAFAEGEWQIWGYEQYIPGVDAAQLLDRECPSSIKWYVLQQALTKMAEYEATGSNGITESSNARTALPHGIDLQPANIVLDHYGAIWLIDTFGPKEIDGAGDLISYNQKLDALPVEALKTVCATREGAIMRFLRKAEGLWLGSGTLDHLDWLAGIEDMMALTCLPDAETAFMLDEINTGYPWLDKVYGAGLSLALHSQQH